MAVLRLTLIVFDLADLLVGPRAVLHGLTGSGKVGGAATRSLPRSLTPNAQRLNHSDNPLVAEKLELSLVGAGKIWYCLVGSGKAQ